MLEAGQVVFGQVNLLHESLGFLIRFQFRKFPFHNLITPDTHPELG
jgi:hypothetical protein